MLKAAEPAPPANTNELISVGMLTGATAGHAGADAPGHRAAGSFPGATPPSSPVTILPSLKTRQKEVGFQILAGAARKLHPSLAAGAVGGVLAFADPAPTACYEIYAAWKEGDTDLARLKQERVAKAATRVASQIGIPGLKYALDLNGYYGGPPRLPLLPPTGEVKAEIEQLMSDVRN